MRSHSWRGNARPTRAEINAAFKAYDVLYSPLSPVTGEMETEMTTANDTAIATVSKGEMEQSQSTALEEVRREETTLATLSADEFREIMDATKAMELSFVEYTSLTKLLEMTAAKEVYARLNIPPAFNKQVERKGGVLPMPFWVTDAVTIRIRNKQAKAGEDPEKTVHVFCMEDVDGLQYYPMLAVNSSRDKIAEGFSRNRLIGRRGRFGPVVIAEVPTGQPQPARVFKPLPGFKPEWTQA